MILQKLSINLTLQGIIKDFMQEQIKPEPKNNKLKYLLMLVIFILLCTNGLLIYFYLNNTNEIIDKKKQLKFTTEELLKAKSSVDSMQVQIEMRIAKFEELSKLHNSKINKNDSIEVKIKELKIALAEMKSLKKNFEKDAGKAWRLYNENKPKIEGYGELLIAKDQEIATLKKELNYLFKENIELKNHKVKVKNDVDSLRFIEETLKKQVKIASTLQAENIVVSYICPQ